MLAQALSRIVCSTVGRTVRSNIPVVLAGLMAALLPTLARAQVVISQVYGGGGNPSAPWKNDFVELFNAGSSPVSLTGWSVQYGASNGAVGATSSFVVPLSGTIQPWSFYLVQMSSAGASGANLPAPDANGTSTPNINMSQTAGKVALANVTTPLNTSTPSGGTILDFVGYGSADFFEGAAAAPGTGNTTAVFRAQNGYTDSNQNGNDFAVYTPFPRNSAFGRNALSASFPWTNFVDFGFDSTTNSLRGMALSKNGASLYCGFIDTSGNALVNMIDTSTGGVINSTAAGSVQSKGIATDDRGYVYISATTSFNQITGTGVFKVLDSTIMNTLSVTTTATNEQISGLSVYKTGSTYYLYVCHGESGSDRPVIERWNVTTVFAPTLDTTWASSGKLFLDLTPFNVGTGQAPRGIEVDSSGVIFVAIRDANRVLKISANGASLLATATLPKPMDVALFGDKLYVSTYNGTVSQIADLKQSDLSVVQTLTTGIARTDTANGYSGLDISSTGVIYVADELYEPSSDRILTSSALPIITVNPSATVACEGSTASFTVNATGASLTYQWRRGTTPLANGGNISGADAATLVINPVTLGDAASDYNVVVTNVGNDATSTNAALSVNAQPATPSSLLASPAVLCPAEGASSVLSASVGGGETVEWFTVSCGGTPVAGGASPTVTPAATTTYYARAKNTTTFCVSANCATVTVFVQDTTPPTITCPAGFGVQCFADIPAGATTISGFTTLGGTYSDNCHAAPTVSYVDGALTGGSCGGTVSRTYTVGDGNGNTAQCVQTITVHDTIAPVLAACPAPSITVECNAIPSPAVVTAADNCDGVLAVAYNEVRTNGACPNTYTLTRTWTATDHCSNATSCSQTIHVQDTTAPVLAGVPADATVECDSVPSPATVTASDNCDLSVTVNYNQTIAPGVNAQTYVITRTWSATDSCSNTVSQSQHITVHDTTAPVLTCAPTVTISWADLKDPPATGVATATDCDPSPTITFVDDRSGLSTCSYVGGRGTLLRTWTARDASGNTSSCLQTVNVIDTTPPVLVACPTDTVVSANASCQAVINFVPPTAYDQQHLQGFEAAQFSAADFNLSQSVDWNNGDVTLLSRVASGTDGIASATGGFHADLFSPIRPANGCCADTTPFSRLGGYSRSFGSGFVTSIDVYFNLADPAIAQNRYTIEVTSAASRQDGNHLSDFVFHIQNSVAQPGHIRVAGDNNAYFLRRGDFDTAYTNYADITASGWYTLRWTFRDNGSGQMVCDMQVVTTGGTVLFTESRTSPSFDIASTVGGNRYMWFTFLDVSHLAIDNTSIRRNLPVVCSVPSNYAFPIGPTAVTCSTTDACGNANSCGFNVTVNDTTAPTLAGCPSDTTVECNAVPAAATVTATDNCDPSVTVVYAEVRTDGTCPNTYTLTRTWTATDSHANTASCQQVIHVQDTTAPMLAGCPAPVLSVSCESVPSAAIVTATDNCDGPTPVVYNEVRTNGACPNTYTLTRTWTATDACSNAASCSQIIHVSDTTAPILAGVPANTTVECSAIPTPPTVTASDNCDTGVSVVYNQSTTPGINAQNYVLTRTWTATDSCSNVATGSQTITVQDTTAPVITCPVTASVECTLVPTPANAGTATALDNCDPAPVLSYLDASSNYIVGPGTPSTGWAKRLVTGTPDPTTATVTFVSGPATPPLGSGSLQMATGSDGDGAAEYRNSNYDGVRLADLTELGYSTYIVNPGSGGQAPYLSLEIDRDGDGQTLDRIHFEPVYQTPVSNPLLPNQGDLVVGQWQHWDALHGGWWSNNGYADLNPGDGVKSIATYVAAYPNARIYNTPNGGIRITAGYGAPDWSNVVASVDNMAIGLRGSTLVYNFEGSGGSCGTVITRTWTATDATGNASHCTQTINLSDSVNPTIASVPPTQTLSAGGACQAQIPDLTASVVASDNCTPTDALLITQSPLAGATVGLGPTDVTITVTDACGNFSTSHVEVDVNDTTAPNIVSCGSDLTAIGGAGCQAQVPDFTAAVVASDNCTAPGALVITQSPLAGTLAPFGPNTVTIFVKDQANNVSQCQRTFTVLTDLAPAASASVTPGVYCFGTQTQISLSASGGTGTTLRWYAGSCGGSSIGSGSPLVIAAPGVSTIYYARWESDCGATDCVQVPVTVNPVPAAAAVGASDSICNGHAFSLTATVPSGITVDWYTGSCGGSPVGTGLSVSVSPTTTTTYYALARDSATNCIATSCNTLTVTVVDPPTANAGSDSTACSPSPVALSGVADHYSSTVWTSSGTGTFGNAAALITNYTFSPADISHGSVVLTLTAHPNTPCAVDAVSSITITITPPPSTVYVDDDYASLAQGTSVNFPYDGGFGPYVVGCTAFATIQAGVNAVQHSTVIVAPGTYNEDVTIAIPGLNLLGSGADLSIIRGVPGGSSATVQVAAANVTISGFTITRQGNAVATWDTNLNNNGLLASSSNGLNVHDNRFEGNRNAINLQFIDDASVHNNIITNNRTGMQLVDNVTNSTFTQNEITNNWTVGVLFRDETPAGSDTTGTVITNNNISGNWYGQIVYRNPDGHPFTTKNFSANWFGSAAPTHTTDNSHEPGYSAQIPVAFGGSAVAPAPGTWPDIAGDASGNFDITPLLSSGADTGLAYGFQGDHSDLIVTTELAQTGSAGRVQEGINLIADGALTGGARTVHVLAGTYLEKPEVTTSCTVSGPNAGIEPCSGTRVAEAIISPDSGAATFAGTTTFVVVSAPSVTIDGLTIDGDNPALTSPFTANGANPDVDLGISAESPSPNDGLIVRNNIIKNIFQFGVALGSTGASSAKAGRVEHNKLDNVPYWAAVLAYDDYYAAIENNCMNNVWLGVQTNNFHLAKPSGSSATISSNTITTQTQVIAGDTTYTGIGGILHNLHYQAASPWTVSGNIITNLTPSSADSEGIIVWSIQETVGATISGNIISGFDRGYVLWNNPTSATITVSGGSVTGGNIGIKATNYDTYGDAASSAYILDGVSLNAFAADGVLVEDSSFATNGSSVRATVTNNSSIHGAGANGVHVSGENAGAIVSGNLSSITGNAIGVLVDGGAALIQTTNLTSNTVAGIQAQNDAIVDAGDCSGSNYTGLGTSTGGNNLSGYGFTNTAPFAIVNSNGSGFHVVLAQGNNFGAGIGDNVADAIYDAADNNTVAAVLFSQSGGQGITTQPTSQSVCAGLPATFSVVDYGAASYQWYKGVNPIGGATSASYTIPVTNLGDIGSYHVEITEPCIVAPYVSDTVTLSVQPGPTADAGGVYATCEGVAAPLSGIAGNAASVSWTSSGDGSFTNGNTVNASYTPGSADVVAGTVTLTLHVLPIGPCAVPATSNATLSVQPLPTATAGGPYSTCASAPAIAITGSATHNGQVTWTTSGSGTFANNHALGTTYLPSLADETAGSVTLTLSAAAIGPCTVAAVSNATLTIQPRPTVLAGGPYYGCGGVAIPVAGSSTYSSSVAWTTSGTGTFADATSAITTYTPSPADVTAGTVTLTLTASPIAPCIGTEASNATITLTGNASITYVDDNYVGLPNGTQVAFPFGGGGPLHTIGCDAFATIQGGIAAVNPSGTVNVAAGSYGEDVDVNKTVALIGPGPNVNPALTAVVHGPIGGTGSSTFRLGAGGITLAGFTITRDGNTLATWNNPGLNSAGVSIQGTFSPGILVRDNLITGMRTAIDINNSSGHTIRNNVINDNRTGLIFRNITDNMTVVENAITNNWTVGVLFLDGSNGSNTPVQTAANSSFSNNTISGNWYGQIVDRQTGGSLPAPGGSLKNFSGNWYGTSTPVITAANSTEPGYAAQIPVAFGGTAVAPAPGTQPDIAGPASANFDITPLLSSGADTSATYGFQGDFSDLIVTAQLAQTGSTGRVQEGVNLLADGSLTGTARTVHALAGAYSDNPVIDRAMSLVGPNAGVAGSSLSRSAEAILYTAIDDPLSNDDTTIISVEHSGVVIDGLTIDGDSPNVSFVNGSPVGAADVNASEGIQNGASAFGPFAQIDHLAIRNNIIKNFRWQGVYLEVDFASAHSFNTIENNLFQNLREGVQTYALHADVSHNKMVDVNRGLSMHGIITPADVGFTPSITGNDISLSWLLQTGSREIGIWVNYRRDNAPALVVADNIIRTPSAPPSGKNWIAFYGLTITDDRTLTFSNNTVTGNGFCKTGYYFSNAPSSNVSITGGTVGGVTGDGVLIVNTDSTWGPGNARVTIDAATINVAAAANGVRVHGDASAPSNTAYALVTNDSVITGGATGVKVEGSTASASIIDNLASVTGNAIGVLVDGGAALIQTTNLSGNSVAGIQAQNDAIVDAGACSITNYSGLGTSTGGNNLSGYGFNDAAPFAIVNNNASAAHAVLAQNNDFGAAASDNIALLIFDQTDNAALAAVLFSQSGGQGITTQPTSQSVCAGLPATFSVVDYGAASYQWYKGMTAIMGANGPSYTIPAASLGDVGSYHVEITEPCIVAPYVSDTVTLSVQPGPTASVGGPYTTCAQGGAVAISASAANSPSGMWTTSGTGSFASPTSLSTTYTPSPSDDALGSVNLVWTAAPTNPCAVVATAQTTLAIQPLPTASAGGTYSTCAAGGAVNIVGTAANTPQVTWTTSGSGSFGNIHALSTTYTPSVADDALGSVTLTLTASPTAPCSINAVSNTALTIQAHPTAIAGGPYYGCSLTPIPVSGTATFGSVVAWTSSGTGTFANAASASTTYTPSPADVTAGTITLTFTVTATSPCTGTAFDTATMTLNATPAVTYVDDNYVGLPNGTQVAFPFSGGGPLHTIGCDAFATIQGGIVAVLASGTVNVAAGNYPEDVSVIKTVHLLGAGPGSSIIEGVSGGPSINTIEVIGQSNVEIAGFTITRQGNAVATWNTNLNNNGLISSSSSGLNVHNNRFEGNRNAINLQFVNTANIHNNVITNNRTGVQMVDNVTASTFTQNEVTDNWTVGILFRDETPAGSDTTGTVLSNNNISGNWYGQIVYRNPDGHPFTTKNFSANWLGTTTPVITAANSTEPGYAAQIPVAFGGTAVAPAPGTQPDIAGDASANFDITPLLSSGADTSATYGFQGDFSDLIVTAQLAQTGSTGRVQEGVNLLADGSLTGTARTVHVRAGAYSDNVSITNQLTLLGAGSGSTPTDTIITSAAANTPVITLTNIGGSDAAHKLLIKDLRVTGGSGAGGNPSSGVRVLTDASTTREYVRFENLASVANAGHGIAFDGSGNYGHIEAIGCTLSNNSTGLRIPTSVPSFDGLDIIGGTIADNAVNGLGINPSGSNAQVTTNVTIDGTTFTHNGAPASTGSGDLSFFAFNGNATIHNVIVNAAAFVPVQFRGHGSGSSGTWTPAGTVTINGLTITGTSARPAIYINRYAAVTGFSFNNVDLSGAVVSSPGWAWGMQVEHIGASPLVLGNTIFPCPGAGNVGLAMENVGGATADCTTVFTGATTLAQKEACVFDHDDNAAVGDVTFLDAAITAGPDSVSVCAGTPVNFTVTTQGPGLSYVWRFNTTPIIGAPNSPTYSIPSAGLGDVGSYDVIVTSACGSLTSAPATLAILPPPSAPSAINISQPTYCTDSIPGTITLTAIGGSGNVFTWYTGSCGGTQIGTGTSIVVTAPNANTTYFGRWSTSCGISGCASASVTIVPAPTASAGSNDVICADGAASLHGTATNYASVHWTGGDGSFNNANILTPSYIPGPNDKTNGSVVLTLTALPNSPCSNPAVSQVTITINPLPVAPTSATVNTNNFCLNSTPTITLTAIGGSGAQVVWTSGSCAGTVVGNGVSLNTAAPTVTTTYFAHWVNGCGISSCASIVVTVVQPPTASAGSPQTICANGVAALAGTATDVSTVHWTGGDGSFNNANILNAVYTPGTNDIAAGSVTLTLTAQPSAPCSARPPAVSSVLITIRPLPVAPTSATVDSPVYCIGSVSTINLTANGGSGLKLAWFEGGCGGPQVGSGTSISLPAPTATTTYFARWINTCGQSACANVTVTVNPLPATPTVGAAGTICSSSSYALTASVGVGETVDWYEGSCGGAVVHTGSPFSVSPTTTTTYFAKARNISTGCVSAACGSILVTVNPQPATPAVGAGGTICEGASFALTASAGSGEVVDWYAGSCGGAVVFTGSPFNVTPSTTTTYYAKARNTSTTCTSAACASVVVTVNPAPATPVVGSSGDICVGEFFALTATVGGGEVVDWYEDSCGGPVVHTGSPFSVNPTSTKSYFARARNTSTSCLSAACAGVTVTVHALPNTPVVGSNTDICSGTSHSLTATVGGGEVVDWYEGSCGGPVVHTGSPFSVSPTTTTTYFAKARNTTTHCVSAACASVTITVNDVPVVPTGASVDHPVFCSGVEPTITLTATGGSGTTLAWYRGACGTNPVGSGPVLNIPAPSISTMYFARWETPTCGNSACVSVAVTVHPSAVAPTSITVDHDNYCSGSVSILTLTALGGSGDSVEWFTDSCGTTAAGSGNPLVLTAPTTTTTYYARWTSVDCGPSTCATYTVTVNPVTGACCTGYGVGKTCILVDPINCTGPTTPSQAYRGNCTVCSAGRCCSADYNNNGTIEIQDIFDFLQGWFAGNINTDFNHSSALEIQDIFDYLTAWFGGCPNV